jgi:single-strand DNA-binding protein
MLKRSEITIEGKLTYREYEDKDGNKRSQTEIRVEELLMHGGAKRRFSPEPAANRIIL